MENRIMPKFINLTDIEKISIDAGYNTWQQNVSGVWQSASAGCALGAFFGGPWGCLVGAHYGPIGWAAITGFTGGFRRR